MLCSTLKNILGITRLEQIVYIYPIFRQLEDYLFVSRIC